jgi:hypothetical protein
MKPNLIVSTQEGSQIQRYTRKAHVKTDAEVAVLYLSQEMRIFGRRRRYKIGTDQNFS